MSSSRFLYLLPVILATACYLATDESWARSTASHSCFFHDGKTLCGEEAELARNEVAEDLKRTMLEQQRKADHGELPQGDDPRFESRASRVAFTGRANTNEKVGILKNVLSLKLNEVFRAMLDLRKAKPVQHRLLVLCPRRPQRQPLRPNLLVLWQQQPQNH